MVEREPQNPVIKALLANADWAFREWSPSLPVNYREHDRPFYPSDRDPGWVLNGLPSLHGQTCEDMIQLKLREKGHIRVFDFCCGTGRAALQLEENNPGITSFGLTGSDFYHTVGISAMRLPESRLIYGNAAHLGELMETRMKGIKFDVIYSFQGLYCIPLPFLYMISQIYPLLEDGGVAFLEHVNPVPCGEMKTEDLSKLKTWLKENGYDFEFAERAAIPPSITNVLKSAFKRTHPQLLLPIEYMPNGLSVFKDR